MCESTIERYMDLAFLATKLESPDASPLTVPVIQARQNQACFWGVYDELSTVNAIHASPAAQSITPGSHCYHFSQNPATCDKWHKSCDKRRKTMSDALNNFNSYDKSHALFWLKKKIITKVMEVIEKLILADLNSSRACRSDAKFCVSLWTSIWFCCTSVPPEKKIVSGLTQHWEPGVKALQILHRESLAPRKTDPFKSRKSRNMSLRNMCKKVTPGRQFQGWWVN